MSAGFGLATGVTGALITPHGTQGGYIDEQRQECGRLIGGALEIVRMLTGRDLFRELLDPIAGDFDAVSAMQQGWHHLSDAAAEVERNWADLDGFLQPNWQGEAADRAAAALAESVRSQSRQAQACALIGDQLGHLVDVARSTTETVCAVLRFIDSLLQEYLLDAALGPVGAAKALVQAQSKVQRLLTLINRAVDAVNGLIRAVTELTAALRALDLLLSVAKRTYAISNDVGHAAAGTWMDETARAGFGS